MSIAQWNNFTDYVVGNQVQNGSSQIYGCILENKNQAPPNVTYWNPLTPAGGGNLVSLQGLTNPNINMTSGDITFTPNAGTGEIDLVVSYPAPPPAGVATLNTLDGALNLTSSTITFTPNAGAGTIDLAVSYPEPPPSVTKLNTLQGDINLTSTQITFTPSGQDLDLGINSNAFISVVTAGGNSYGGPTLALESADGSVVFTTGGVGALNLQAVPSPIQKVTTLNTLDGVVNLTSLEIDFSTTGGGNTIDLSLKTGAVVKSITAAGTDITGAVTLKAGSGLTVTNPSAQLVEYSQTQLTQFGAGAINVATFPAFQTITLPTAYDDTSFAISVQLRNAEGLPTWSQITGGTNATFDISWDSTNPTGRTILYNWITVGATPAP